MRSRHIKDAVRFATERLMFPKGCFVNEMFRAKQGTQFVKHAL